MIRCGEPQIGERERDYVSRVLAGGQLTEGPWVKLFADRVAGVTGRRAVPVSSGTAALHVAMLACGVGPGDEVIVPATTYVATANAALMCGAVPVVGDVNPRTWTLEPDAVKALLTSRTRAVVPVHLYGVPADVVTIKGVIYEYYKTTGQRVAVIEDCAEAIGATVGDQPVGSLGDAAAFSFYASKTVTTAGEGGAVVCACPAVHDRAWHLSHQAMTPTRYVHDCLGFNYRMTEIQAAFGVAQIERLEEFLDRRRQIFAWYDEGLRGLPFQRQRLPDGCSHGYWAYAIVCASLVGKKLPFETRPVFPPVSSFRHIPRRAATPQADLLHKFGTVLPTHAGMTEGDVRYVCEWVRNAIA